MPDESIQRLKLIMAAFGPIQGETEKERMAEALRRFELAHNITPEDAAKMEAERKARMAELTDEQRAKVAEIEAEVADIRMAIDEKRKTTPTIQ